MKLLDMDRDMPKIVWWACWQAFVYQNGCYLRIVDEGGGGGGGGVGGETHV